ncbi:hypothetical protein CEXT_26441, partial [Caerostris extrusa]
MSPIHNPPKGMGDSREECGSADFLEIQPVE